MTQPLDMAALRARFHACVAERKRLIAETEPIGAQYENLRRQQCGIDDQMAPLKAQLKAARAPIVELEREAAMLARLLQGQTGKAG